MSLNDRRIGLKTAAAVLIALSASLGACSSDQVHDYRAHSDRVTAGAGNAAAANMAMHTVDPWPYNSQKTQIDMDGKRAQLAVKRYETNTSIKPKGLASDATFVLGGAGK